MVFLVCFHLVVLFFGVNIDIPLSKKSCLCYGLPCSVFFSRQPDAEDTLEGAASPSLTSLLHGHPSSATGVDREIQTQASGCPWTCRIPDTLFPLSCTSIFKGS